MAVDIYDVSDLFAQVLGYNPEDYPEDEVEDKCIQKYGLDFEELATLIEDLLPYCAEGRSPLTDTRYRGFAHNGAFIIKQEIPSNG